MARRLELFLLITTLSVAGGNLPHLQKAALAAGLDPKGEADAKEATKLYKQGHFEEAAQIFAKLSVDYPEMEIFERNVGACFYYLNKPEPALSNLRDYLRRNKNIEPDDKAVVDRWIDEMEKLRAQNTAASVQPKVQTAPAEPEQPTKTVGDGTAQAGSAQGATASSIAPKPGEVADRPAGLDLSANPGTNNPTEAGKPIYKTWWFWTGAAAVVVAGTVTAILIAGRSSSPCSGASLACVGVK